ncbi:hypothetical protein UM538_12655 [Staphylococcus aureus]|nr:hypothetical protein UM538_12655 [Staphylococcus aureus]
MINALKAKNTHINGVLASQNPFVVSNTGDVTVNYRDGSQDSVEAFKCYYI